MNEMGNDEIDVEALLEESKGKARVQCDTCRWLSTRPLPERVKWTLAVEGSGYTASQIARAMSKASDDAPRMNSVQRHRRERHWEKA